MKLIESSHHGHWHHEGCSHEVNANNPRELVEAYRPGLIVSLNEAMRLNEYSYSDLAKLIDGTFLSQKVRADELKRVEFQYVDEQGVINFDVPSSEFDMNGIKYRNLVQFMEWDSVGQDESYGNYVDRARLLLWSGNVKLFCSCPSFIFWGYQWCLTVLDASVYPETREPKVRNPKHQGIVCKHLNRVLRVLPFYSGRMAGAMKEQFG